MQVNMQALVLVSLFRQQTRDKLMEYIEWCLPDRIPWLWDRMGYRQTPAQMVHSAIVDKIGAFQASVARRQSVSRSDQRSGVLPGSKHAQSPPRATLRPFFAIRKISSCLVAVRQSQRTESPE